MSELDRISKLYEFSHVFKLYKDYIPFQLCLDVEGWNDKFRSNLVNPCAESLYGQWFGQTGLRSHTMDLYENAYFIQSNAYGRAYWNGQSSGIEGLNQYTWIGVYIGIALLVFDSLGMRYSLMDNGDDHRVCVWVHKTIVEQHQSHSQTAAWLKNMIADQMILYGNKIKVSETYCSENLVAYSQIYL